MARGSHLRLHRRSSSRFWLAEALPARAASTARARALWRTCSPRAAGQATATCEGVASGCSARRWLPDDPAAAEQRLARPRRDPRRDRRPERAGASARARQAVAASRGRSAPAPAMLERGAPALRGARHARRASGRARQPCRPDRWTAARPVAPRSEVAYQPATNRWRRTSAAPNTVPCSRIHAGQRRARVHHERPDDLTLWPSRRSASTTPAGMRSSTSRTPLGREPVDRRSSPGSAAS